MGWIAQEDTNQVEIILRIVDQRVSQLLDERDAAVIHESIGKIRKACSKKKSRRVWDKVKDHAARIANRVKTASSLIGVDEGSALDLGRALGSVYVHSDDSPDEATRTRIRRQALSVVPDAEDAIDEAMERVAEARAGYSWAPTIYTQMTREIRSLT